IRFESLESVTIETGEAALRAHPDETGAVLGERRNGWHRQTLVYCEVPESFIGKFFPALAGKSRCGCNREGCEKQDPKLGAKAAWTPPPTSRCPRSPHRRDKLVDAIRHCCSRSAGAWRQAAGHKYAGYPQPTLSCAIFAQTVDKRYGRRQDKARVINMAAKNRSAHIRTCGQV